MAVAAHPPPTAESEDHLRRIMHRTAGVRAVQRSADYTAAAAVLPEDLMPEPPDPFDVAAYSHRAWERAMVQWRRQVKHAYILAESLALVVDGLR